jgi:sarcosine oxidase
MGSSAAWHLASRGEQMTLFEHFRPGHDRGSPHGNSRIFRLAYPDLRADTTALFHPEAGRLHADHSAAAFQQAARQGGARIRHGVKVTRLSVRGERAEVVTEGEEAVIADAVVVAVGGWAPSRLSGPVPGPPPMRVIQEQPVRFPAPDALGRPSSSTTPGPGSRPTAAESTDSTARTASKSASTVPGLSSIGDRRDRTVDPARSARSSGTPPAGCPASTTRARQ